MGESYQEQQFKIDWANLIGDDGKVIDHLRSGFMLRKDARQVFATIDKGALTAPVIRCLDLIAAKLHVHKDEIDWDTALSHGVSVVFHPSEYAELCNDTGAHSRRDLQAAVEDLMELTFSYFDTAPTIDAVHKRCLGPADVKTRVIGNQKRFKNDGAIAVFVMGSFLEMIIRIVRYQEYQRFITYHSDAHKKLRRPESLVLMQVGLWGLSCAPGNSIEPIEFTLPLSYLRMMIGKNQKGVSAERFFSRSVEPALAELQAHAADLGFDLDIVLRKSAPRQWECVFCVRQHAVRQEAMIPAARRLLGFIRKLHARGEKGRDLSEGDLLRVLGINVQRLDARGPDFIIKRAFREVRSHGEFNVQHKTQKRPDGSIHYLIFFEPNRKPEAKRPVQPSLLDDQETAAPAPDGRVQAVPEPEPEPERADAGPQAQEGLAREQMDLIWSALGSKRPSPERSRVRRRRGR